MNPAYVVGYDPGGNGSHGVAVLRVKMVSGRWTPVDLAVTTELWLSDVVDRLETACSGARIMAAGADTLTEWSTGCAGWRPADRWLKERYPEIGPRVKSPNGLRGSMIANGAAFLLRLENRFRSDRTMVTEAHPKVCYYALTGKKPDWSQDCEKMVAWLTGELHPSAEEMAADAEDHRFDAAMGALAALRGLNGDWTHDLHTIGDEDCGEAVRYCGSTHYWWPQ